MSDKPKRPMSAYLLWLNSARDKIKSDHPGLKVTEIAKKAGEIWRGMDDKTEWEAKAAKAKEQYTADLESYNANGGDGAAPEEKKKKPQKRGKKAKTTTAAAAKSRKKKEESENEMDDNSDFGDSE